MPNEPIRVDIEVDLGENGGKRHFSFLQEIQDWIDGDVRAWEWLIRRDGVRIHEGNAIYQHLANAVNPIRGTIDLVKQRSGRSDVGDTIQELKRQLEDVYRRGSIISAESSKASLVLSEVSKQDPSGRAVGAVMLAYFLNLPSCLDPNSPYTYRGTVKAGLFENNVKGVADGEVEGMKRASSLLQRLSQEAKAKFQEYKDQWEKFSSQSKAVSDERQQTFNTFMEASAKELEALKEKVSGEFAQLESVYREKLGLHSAVTYWTDKGKRHLVWACWFFLLVLLTFGVVGWGLYETVKQVGLGVKISEVQLGQLSLVLIIATVGVWLLRLLVRIFLSRLHLQTDAAERATMIQTYLALVNEGKLSDKGDERLILQAIFRPTATGIVKDDASPPFMAEWLKRTTGSD